MQARQYFTAPALGIALVVSELVAAECDERDVRLTDVPPAVMAAATAAVDRIVISEAEQTGAGAGAGAVYELEGEADGIGYEITVSPAGEILGVEQDDD